MKKDNPFTLTFRRQPCAYISRCENTEAILSAFESDHAVIQTYLIEGVRGSGKTVLMTAVANNLAKQDGWVVVNLTPTGDLLEDLAFRLADACQEIPDFTGSGFSASAAGFGIGVNGSAGSHDSISRIQAILSGLKRRQKKVLITIDDVVSSENMRAFAGQFQIFLREEYPVFLLMTGLYGNITSIQNDPALTFLLRSPKICLEPLRIAQIT